MPEELWRRQEITQELATKFLCEHRKNRCAFTPIGVAQGWSPNSYAAAVKSLQGMGYKYIGLGGMVPLKTDEILSCLQAANEVRKRSTRFHLFGVTRPLHIGRFQDFGVVSFDSTSPLRQAFKHDRENYYTLDGTYSAIRVPQVEGNQSLQSRIAAGEIDQREARRLEQACIKALRAYDSRVSTLSEVLALLREYDCLFDGRKDRTEDYREVLLNRPWKSCPCAICQQIGIDIILFRGAERNRRRGFHNVFVTYKRLQNELALLKKDK